MISLEEQHWQISQDRQYVLCNVRPEQQPDITQQLQRATVKHFIAPLKKGLLQITVDISEFTKLKIFPPSIKAQVNEAVISARTDENGRIVDFMDNIQGLIKAANAIHRAVTAPSAPPLNRTTPPPSASAFTAQTLETARFLYHPANQQGTRDPFPYKTFVESNSLPQVQGELHQAGLTQNLYRLTPTNNGIRVELKQAGHEQWAAAHNKPAPPVASRPSAILPQAEWTHNKGISTAVIACPPQTSPATFKEQIKNELINAGLPPRDCQVISTDKGVQVSLTSFGYSVAVDKDRHVAGPRKKEAPPGAMPADRTQQPARGKEETPPMGMPLPPAVPGRIDGTAYRAKLHGSSPSLPPAAPPPHSPQIVHPFGNPLPNAATLPPHAPPPSPVPPPAPPPPASRVTPRDGMPVAEGWRQHLTDIPFGTPPKGSGGIRR